MGKMNEIFKLMAYMRSYQNEIDIKTNQAYFREGTDYDYNRGLSDGLQIVFDWIEWKRVKKHTSEYKMQQIKEYGNENG